MTRLQRIQMKQSELRQALGEVLDQPEEERVEGKLEELTAKIKSGEVELRAAITAEAEDDMPDDTEEETGDAEEREYRELIAEADATDYFAEVVGGRKVDGASRELREHSMGGNMLGFMPIDIIAPHEQREERAVSDIANAIQDNQQSIAGRIFARSDTAWLGASMPTVPVGTVTYPRLNAGTVAGAPKVDNAVTGSAATLATKSINPQRITAEYIWGIETEAKISGWEAALRQDLRETMSSKLDDLIVTGQSATSTSGVEAAKFNGLLNSLGSAVGEGSGAVSWSTFLKLMDSEVDGKIVYSPSDVGLYIGVGLYQAVLALEAGTSGNSGLFRDYIQGDMIRVASTDRIAAIGSKKQKLIKRLSVPDRIRGLFVPTWRGMEIISDPYTSAGKGQRKITAIMVVGADVVDARAYKYIDFTLQA